MVLTHASVGVKPATTLRVNVVGKCSRLTDAAIAPRQTTAAASTTSTAPSAAATATSAAAPATSAASAASTPLCNLFPDVGRAGVLLVEDVERPQANVGDFFFTERDLGRGDIPGGRIRGRHSSRRRRSARQRQRHADDSHHRYGFLPTLSLRSVLRMWHCRVLQGDYARLGHEWPLFLPPKVRRPDRGNWPGGI
jgi:hypothetical protein